MNFNIPLTWLLTVIVFGLVKFGMDYQDFAEIKRQNVSILSKISSMEAKDGDQDGDRKAIEVRVQSVEGRVLRIETILDRRTK